MALNKNKNRSISGTRFFTVNKPLKIHSDLAVLTQRVLRPGSKMCSEHMNNWQYLSLSHGMSRDQN